MSVDRCAMCGFAVDTDVDLECYGEDGDEECHCEYCRAYLLASELEDQRLDDPHRRAV